MKRIYPARLITRYPLTSFFALTFLLIWLSLAANVSGHFPAFGEWPVSFQGHLVGVLRTRRTLINWIPNLAAVIVLSVTGGWEAVRHLFARFLKWRVGIGSWSAALLLPVATASMAVGIYGLAGGDINLSFVGSIPAVFFIRFIFALSAEGVGGEAGWRGFALERMQRKYTPLVASIVVGIFWALCHLPIVTIRGFDAVELSAFMATVMSLSVILTWFYNRTKGSLLIVAVVHCLFDAVDAAYSRNFTALLPRKEFMAAFMAVLVVTAVILIASTRGRLGLIRARESV
ncbi:MAG: CPBP family intramembrane metalloprotease [Candidatus Omnitrophica bacterium]|nr:CPBP family intramembrane metalloprotease [Candidatus Omnitrophota bacterium]